MRDQETLEAYQGDQPYIFVSYSHQDSDRVLPIIRRMQEEGYRVWYDEGIDPGTEWPEYIAARLSGCHACLALLSKHAIESHNCRREINYALSKGIRFLSVMLEETELSPGMELQISSYQSLLKYRYPKEETFYQKLFQVDLLSPCREMKPAAEEVKTVADEGGHTAGDDGRAVSAVEDGHTADDDRAAPTAADTNKTGSGHTGAPQEPQSPTETTGKPASGGRRGRKWLILAVVLAACALIFFLRSRTNQVKIGGETYKDAYDITLTDTSVTGGQMKKLSAFTELRNLTLTGCTLQEGALDLLSGSETLRRLTLTDCTGAEMPGNLSGMTGLRALTLSGCGLTDAGSLVLPSGLEELDLSDNSLSELPQLPTDSLQVLRIGGNQIEDISMLEDAIYLEEVDLSGNPLTDLGGLANCTRLEKLNLHGTEEAESDGSSTFGSPIKQNLNKGETTSASDIISKNAGTLRYLDISGTDAFEAASQLADLAYLRAEDCGLTDEDLEAVGAMSSLQWLDLSGNELTGVPALSGAEALKILDLRDNRIASLSGLPSTNIQVLLLSGNVLQSPEGLAEAAEYRVLDVDDNPLEDLTGIDQVSYVDYLIVNLEGEISFEPLSGGTVYRLCITGLDKDRQVELEEIIPKSKHLYADSGDDALADALGMITLTAEARAMLDDS